MNNLPVNKHRKLPVKDPLAEASPGMAAWLRDREVSALQWRADLLRAGELVTTEAVCTGLSITPAQLARRVTTGAMFSIEVGTESFFPTFFLDRSVAQANLRAVRRCLAPLDDARKWLFLTRPKLSLNGLSPIDALRADRYAPVLRAANAFLER